METLIILQLVLIGVLMWFLRKEQREKDAVVAKRIEKSDELKKTMAMGLTYRFNFPRAKNKNDELEFKEGSDLFLKQTPLEFEDFVGKIIKYNFGGHVYTTTQSPDHGVHFEHHINDELYLGQVNVLKENIGAQRIAVLHSNMINNGAKGGYVITTSDFSKSAQDYAKDLDITLIDGVTLVNYWLETMDSKVYEPGEEFA